MKKYYLFFTLAFALLSCGDSNENTTSHSAKNYQMTECKTVAETRLGDDVLKESIECNAISDGYLHVVHCNLPTVCDVERIDIKVTVEGKKIMVEEIPVGGGDVNCICPRDVSYDIGPFEGKGYTLSVNGKTVIINS